MAETLTEQWQPLPVKPARRTHVVIVTQTTGRRFNAYRDSVRIVSEATKPIEDSARALLAMGFGPDDRVVIRLSGAAGNEHEGLVSTLGKLAAKQD